MKRLIGKKTWNITPLFNREAPCTKELLKCKCKCDTIWYKEHVVFEHNIKGEFRVDIITKCDDCAVVEKHGVHLTKKEFEKIKEA